MDFNDLMNLAACNEKGGDKKHNNYSFNLSAPKKEQKPKQKSEVVQRLINEKEREKSMAKERIRHRQQKEEKKKIFRIPKAGSSGLNAKEKKFNDNKNHKPSSRQGKPVEKPKTKLEESVFRDLQEKNELYNRNDRARINFDGSFAVVRIAHKRKDGVPLPRRPVPAPVKEVPKFNVALIKKSDKINSDNSNLNSHQASSPKNVSETVHQLKEKYGVNPEGISKKERAKSTKRRDNKLKEIEKYKEKIKTREKLKAKEKKDKMRPKPKIVRRTAANAPPPMNFAELLKMAEAKQKEPIKVEVVKKKPKQEEEARPMTQEQKDWAGKKKDWKDRKKSQDYPERLGKNNSIPPKTQTPIKSYKVPKHSQQNPPSSVDNKNNNNTNIRLPQHLEQRRKPASSIPQSLNANKSFKNSSQPQNNNFSSSRDQRGYEQDHNDKNCVNSVSSNSKQTPQSMKRKHEQTNENVLQCGPSEFKRKAPPLPEEASNPWDRIYGSIKKNHPKRPVKKKMVIDSDEDEYDSELDDFIDDGDGGAADYSSAIKQIFGYDKRRYRDEDDDVDNMESNFASCMKEEARSARLGLQEDLEDIRKEQEEERRKALMKKKRR